MTDPRLKISGKRATFISQYLDDVSDDVVQTQAVNAEREDVYLTVARGLVLCFGHDNPLSNDTPNQAYWDLKLVDIPAANEMPPLPEDESIKRDAVISSMVQRVRNYMKHLRHKARISNGQTAGLDQKRIDRVLNAFAPAPKPPRPLDVYQKFFKARYIDNFDKMWQAKVDAAEGNATLLTRLGDVRGGQEHVFASLRWSRETSEIVEEVEKRRYSLHREECDRYAELWGAPPNMVSTSRAWALPEAGTFFQAILNWAAVRFGVAMSMTIAGKPNKGEPEARSLFASGEVKEGAPALDAVAAHSTEATKVALSQYVRDMLTSNVPKDVTPLVPGAAVDDLEVAQEFKEDVTGKPRAEGSRLEGKAGPLGSSSYTRNIDSGKKPARVRKSIDMDVDERLDLDLELDVHYDGNAEAGGMDVDDVERELLQNVGGRSKAWKGKGKEVLRLPQRGRVGRESGAQDNEEMEDFSAQVLAEDYEDEDNNGDLTFMAGGVARTPPANTGLSAAFANTLDEDDFAMGGQDQWARNMTPDTRASSPETSTSVYSERLNNMDKAADAAALVNGDNAGDMWQIVEDEDVEADIEALMAGMYSDRQQKATKKKTPRTYLLGGVKRAGSGQSRKKDAGKIQEGDKADASEGKERSEGDGQKTTKGSANDKGKGSRTRQASRSVNATRADEAAGVVSRAKALGAAALRTENAQPVEVPSGAENDHSRDSFSPPPVISAPRQARRLRITSPEEEEPSEPRVAGGDARIKRGGETDAARMNGWIGDHTRDETKDGVQNAWKVYVSKNMNDGTASRRTLLAEAMRILPVNMHLTHAELVDNMENLLREDERWDAGPGGQLDSQSRPKEVGHMTKARGGIISSKLPVGWGAKMAAWWVSLQPAERGVVTAVKDLRAPTASMDWSALSTPSGYKGAFLLAWSMMHWAQSSNDLALWQTVADDMASAFKAMLSWRRGRVTGSAAAAGPSSTQRGRPKRAPVASSAEEEQRHRKKSRR
ncbi:unnamed protein product [Peniophora sp. CBMAI 1063]|nr:unnamed protein product [Peniophora sp. CBMAI 1063]